MLNSWVNVLIHPGESSIEKEMERLNGVSPSSLIWFGLAILCAALISAAGIFFTELLEFRGSGIRTAFTIYVLGQLGFDHDIRSTAEIIESPFVGAVYTFCIRILYWPLFLLIGSSVCFGLAKVMGGIGTFRAQNYSLMLFVAPLLIIHSLTLFIPCIWPCTSSLIWVYSIVLSYFAVKFVHNLSAAKTVAVVGISFVILTTIIVFTTSTSI